MFFHSHPEMIRHQHASVAQAKECEAQYEWEASMPPEPSMTCPVCDAYNCGGNGGGCRQYEWGSSVQQYEAEQERALEAELAYWLEKKEPLVVPHFAPPTEADFAYWAWKE